MIRIDNNGPEIVSTDYWQSPHAARGLCYLSGNAGAWRLLVPRAAETLLSEMRTGRSASIEPSMHEPGVAWDVVFHDGSTSPFSLAIDKRQVDRAVRPGKCALSVWTEGGKQLELQCEILP